MFERINGVFPQVIQFHCRYCYIAALSVVGGMQYMVFVWITLGGVVSWKFAGVECHRHLA